MTHAFIQRRCEMKSYDELKAEMETIQQQMAEAKNPIPFPKFPPQQYLPY